MYVPWLLPDIWSGTHAGSAEIAARQQGRLADLVAYARRRVPGYAAHYAGLPAQGWALADLPPLDKTTLMAQFDRWLAEPGPRFADVEAFIRQDRRIGDLMQGRYAVWKTSGSTGEIGLFVHDEFALAVYDTLFGVRAWQRMTSLTTTLKMSRHGGRMACILASEDHYAGISSWRHQARAYPWLAPLMRDFSVMTPLPELCRRLQDWDPGQIVAYPSVLSLLAQEQRAGRLRLEPAILIAGGEMLDAGERALIESAFGCRVHDVYACSECDYVAFSCPHGWLHANADWVILEPIDADGRPVPPGTPSASCLLTNLANRVQPIVRYDLADSITVKPEPCACGSPLPAIRVEGRVNQRLLLSDAAGRQVPLLPLAVGTVLEGVDGLRRFQVVQTGPCALEVRCTPAPDAAVPDLHRRTIDAMRAYLATQGLANVSVRIAAEEPCADPHSGKLQQVVRAPDATTAAPG